MPFAHQLTPARLGPLGPLLVHLARLLGLAGARDVDAGFDDDRDVEPEPEDDREPTGDRLRIRRFLGAFADRGIGLLDRNGGLMLDGGPVCGWHVRSPERIDEVLDELGPLPSRPDAPRRRITSASVDAEAVELKAEIERLESANIKARVAELEHRETQAAATAAESKARQGRMRRMLSASGLGCQVLESKGIDPDWRGTSAPDGPIGPDRIADLLKGSSEGQKALDARRSL